MHIVVEYFTANYISTFITFTSDKTTKLSRLKRYTCCILVINEDESRGRVEGCACYIHLANEEEISGGGGILISPALCF